MSSAMGSLWVFVFWGGALWRGECAMSVRGSRGSWGSVRVGVVALCGCWLGAVSACGFDPGCGLSCGWWWALGWCVVCGVPGAGVGGGGFGAGVARCRSCVGGLWRLMSLGSARWCVAVSLAGLSAGACEVVRRCCVVCLFPRGGGGIVPRAGWVGGCSWLVIRR